MKEKAGKAGNFLVGLILSLVLLAGVTHAQGLHDPLPLGNIGNSGILSGHHHHHHPQ